MDGASLLAIADRFLNQDQDLAFAFSAAAGEFVVVSFTANEAVNAPFEVHIELASEEANIDLHALMDTQASLGIYDKYDAPRFLNGVITEVARGDSGIRRTFYSVTLRPALHRLAHTSDSRIWQSKTVPEIVKEVLAAHNVHSVDWRLAGDHAVREYCTQYRETALAFVERLLGEEGIFYFFEHSASDHTMLLTDAPLSTPVLTAAPVIPYNATSGGQLKGSAISSFSQRERLRSSTYEMNDYTFKNPAARQNQTRAKQEDNGLAGDYPLYDYPGRYKDPKAVGGSFTQHRMEAVRVDATTGHGQTNNIHLCPGFHVSISDHDDGAVNGSHFLLGVSHSGSQSAALEEDAGSGATTYGASFTTMPARLPYRPAVMQRPLVDGPQIATVTGPAGEEIYCDEHGRVKVYFPWDRYGQKDEHSSCWIRVSQNWAGGTYGSIAIPRIGHEVIVDYLEGDPDQPIVTGRTYHASNKVPYGLPENKTKTVIRSDTHKGDGFNEISFEDENGSENIALHAQKDQTLKVLNNRMKRIDNDQVESVGSNKSIDVGNNHQEKIGGSMNLSVGGGGGGLFGMLAGLVGGAGAAMKAGAEEAGDETATAFVGGLAEAGVAGEALSAGGSATFLSAGANRKIAGAAQASAGTALGALLSKVMPTSGIMNVIVEKAKSETIGVASTQQVGVIKNTMVGAIQNTTVGKNSNTTVGDTMTVEVGEELIFKVGKSQLTLKKDGSIRLLGDNLNITMENDVQVFGKTIDLN